MEKELYKALALVLLEKRTDQWGNDVMSPLDFALSKWVTDNKEEIQKLIIDKLDLNKLADEVVAKITKDLSWTSGSWNKNYQKEKLDELVLQKLADKMADEQLKKLKEIV